MQSLVSIIIPTYNRETTISRSINSVLTQSYTNFELIIVDDGSTDNTIEIVNSYKDERIKLIRLGKNCGANVARNKGICAAKGEYIAFQDSDDEWVKSKLESQLKYMLDSDKKACYCSLTIIYPDGGKNVLPGKIKNKELYEIGITDILRKRNIVSTQTLIVAKEVFSNVGMFDESFKRWQDYEFVIRLCEYYQIGYIEKPLVNVYRLDDSISNNRSVLLETCSKILTKHSDFLDFNSILHKYMFNCEWYDTEKLYFESLDDFFQAINIKKSEEIIKLYNNAKIIMFQWYTYFSENIIGKKFVIYGAGVYGRGVYYTLKSLGIIPQCFWVTFKKNENNIDKIPIIELPDNIDKQLAVIIAVDKNKQEVLVKNLISRNVSNYIIYPFC